MALRRMSVAATLTADKTLPPVTLTGNRRQKTHQHTLKNIFAERRLAATHGPSGP